eukprot:4820396-Lingulodinium_polyedra.AAC.1
MFGSWFWLKVTVAHSASAGAGDLAAVCALALKARREDDNKSGCGPAQLVLSQQPRMVGDAL